MACENIKNAFYALTGQVSPRLYNRISINDPWVAYVEKGEWPTGMGYTINSMMLERTLTDYGERNRMGECNAFGQPGSMCVTDEQQLFAYS